MGSAESGSAARGPLAESMPESTRGEVLLLLSLALEPLQCPCSAHDSSSPACLSAPLTMPSNVGDAQGSSVATRLARLMPAGSAAQNRTPSHACLLLGRRPPINPHFGHLLRA